MLQKALFEITRFLSCRRSLKTCSIIEKAPTISTQNHSLTDITSESTFFKTVLKLSISDQKFIATSRNISRNLIQNLIRTV